MTPARFLAAAALFALAVPSPATAKGKKGAFDFFKEYLEKEYPGKKWNSGPTALTSKELEKAYPDRQFFFVHSSPPLPPGAPLKELLEQHRQRMEDFTKNYISVTAVWAGEKFTPVSGKAESFNAGLMAVKTDDDARTAAAAILSVCPERNAPPTAVSANDVKVTKTDKGWACQFQKNWTEGRVEFDAAGKCVAARKTTIIPLPPSAPPRPPVAPPKP